MNRPLFSTPTLRNAILCSILSLSACSGPEYFAISPDGKNAGAMQIKAKEGGTSITLDAKTPVVRGDSNTASAAQIDANELRNKFKEAVSAQPLPPARFVLYFVEGGDTLTAESQASVAAILNEIKNRPAPDLVIIGHTDRVGLVRDNDHLAAKRAVSTRQYFVSRGIDAENIQASGRGEREPLVPTADEVAEPRNRRVEILVR